MLNYVQITRKLHKECQVKGYVYKPIGQAHLWSLIKS